MSEAVVTLSLSYLRLSDSRESGTEGAENIGQSSKRKLWLNIGTSYSSFNNYSRVLNTRMGPNN